MTKAQRATSVRAIGARRLTQATVGMIVVSVGGVAVLAVHDSQLPHASAVVTRSSSTQNATDSGGGSSTTDLSNSSSSSSSVVATQSTPQATSGGS
jgi:hypothetical protein